MHVYIYNIYIYVYAYTPLHSSDFFTRLVRATLPAWGNPKSRAELNHNLGSWGPSQLMSVGHSSPKWL